MSEALLRELLAGQKALQQDVTGLKQDVARLEERTDRLERKLDGFQGWFTTLGEKVDRLEQTVDTLRGEVAETRELMANMRDDDVVQRQAIAKLKHDIDELRE